MSLRRFLTVGLVIIVLCSGLTALTLYYSTHLTGDAIASLTESVESAASAEKIQQNLALHRRQALLKEIRSQDQRLEETRRAKVELLKNSEDLARFSSSPDEEVFIQKVRQSIVSYLANYDTLQAKGVRGNELYQSVSEEYYTTQQAIQDLMKFNLDEARHLEEISASQNKTNYALVAFALVLLTFSVFILFLGLRKFFYKPILILNKQIESFELGQDIPQAAPFSAALEIESLASSFTNLSSKLSRQKDTQLTFLSSIAHDLKNPLGAIKMSVEILDEDKSLLKESHEMLSIIGRQSDHLLRLIGDLLDTTRVESGHLSLDLKTCDIRNILKDSAKLHSNLSSRHQIELRLPDETILVECDDQRLTQVFNNLFNNAIKYSPNGGTIICDVSKNNKHVEIKIIDNGVGIPAAELDGVFEPFHRSSTTRSTIAGIGLGLSASRKIVRAHRDGEILVASDKRGTTFTVRLALQRKTV